MDSRRVLGAAVISLTGFGLAAIAVQQSLTGLDGLAGAGVAAGTFLFGAGFVLTGPLAYRSSLESRHLLRIAGWNTLGVVVTTLVLFLIYAFQVATDGDLTAPLLSGALVVAVSTFAHNLIGLNDVRRIRARRVARQRQKAAVMNRFVRHNLSHSAQLLMGYGQQLVAESETEDSRDLAQHVVDIGTNLSETGEQIRVFDEVLETENPRRSVDVGETIRRLREGWTDDHPGGELEVTVPDGLTVRAGDYLDVVFEELVDNAFRYGGQEPTVTIRGQREGDTVVVEILDTGEGFPNDEVALINDDETETQLRHSSGMGLWLAKWVLEHYGGTLSLGEADTGGGAVEIRLPAAD